MIFPHGGQIIQVGLEKFEARIFERGGEVFAPAEFQIVNAGDRRAAREQRVHEMAADESGGAGDEAWVWAVHVADEMKAGLRSGVQPGERWLVERIFESGGDDTARHSVGR